MATRTATSRSGSARDVENGLLARLGLPASASAQDVEAAHDGLIGFLETAPTDLRLWASVEIDRVDEAYALLSDPTIDRSAVAEMPGPHPPSGAVTASAPAEVGPSPKAIGSAGTSTPAGGHRLVRRLAVVAAATALVAVVLVVGFNMGSGSSVPGVNGSPDPAAAASPGVDLAKVGALMEKIQANPKDVTSLQALADAYYVANDFDTASGFLEKIIAVDPTNLTARLALGAARFNLGKPDEAEAQWRDVLTSDPNNVEAHYDLGFMYLSRNPADVAQARVEWGKVIALAPDSDVAKSIQQHLASLDASPAPSAAPSGAASSPAPAASPAVTGGPAPSPASVN